MQGIRAAIVAHNNATLPDPPPRPRIVAYGNVALTQQGALLDHIAELFPGKGIYSQAPQPMEDYGEGCAAMLCQSSLITLLLSGCSVHACPGRLSAADGGCTEMPLLCFRVELSTFKSNFLWAKLQKSPCMSVTLLQWGAVCKCTGWCWSG